jgi:ubiquitin conjugation factor E4 B
MVNLQSILYKFADPFIDATYSKVSRLPVSTLFDPDGPYFMKMDRVDPLFYIHSNRVDLSDETRIKATSEEANEWAQANRDPKGTVGSL